MRLLKLFAFLLAEENVRTQWPLRPFIHYSQLILVAKLEKRYLSIDFLLGIFLLGFLKSFLEHELRVRMRHLVGVW